MSELLARSPFVTFVVNKLKDQVPQETILEEAKIKFKDSCIGPHNISQVVKAFNRGVYTPRESSTKHEQEGENDVNYDIS